MKILSSQQTQELDRYTIENEPILSINLMERAARQCADWIINKYPANTRFAIFAGPGNNGGDGLAIARMLCDKRFHVRCYICSDKMSNDARINYERLKVQNVSSIKFVNAADDLPEIKPNELVVDSLFGSGLKRPVEGFFHEIIKFLNDSPASIISIDIPSGLFSEDNSDLAINEAGAYSNVIQANYTLSLELPFLSFFFPDSQHHLGQLEILPIGLSKTYLNQINTNYYYTDSKSVKSMVKGRNKFAHKGNFGHAFIIAGSYGKMGAAVLACKACLRTGVGLLTTHIPVSGYEIMQTAVPEAMVCIDESGSRFCQVDWQNYYSAIGIGPGLGKSKSARRLLENILKLTQKPLVIDADGINILSENKEILQYLPANSILTPHIGEFKRLAGEWTTNYERLQMQINFSTKYNVYIVLKGHNTCVSTPEGKCFFNSSGNPGMATAGSGDVLTGIISSLLAQGYNAEEAAILGVYLHGLAGDIAAKSVGQHSLIASDIINNLGAAFIQLTK